MRRDAPPGPLRVCLDARLEDGSAGGIQQFIMGLASGLARLSDGDEEYLFLSRSGSRTWLEPHLGGRARPLDAREGRGVVEPSWLRAGRALGLPALVERTPLGRIAPVGASSSDGTVEAAGVDLVHFTAQDGFLTRLPSIYQPYDLQHEHFPQFFSPYALRRRRAVYGALARAARCVVVMSSWVKQDVIDRLALPEAKVRVIAWGPVTEEYPVPTAEELAAARAELRLPERFGLFPAQTFPHKNHLGLLEAVADVRRRTGTEIPVICPGRQSDHYEIVRRRSRALGLERLVLFPGYLAPGRLRALYALATFLVFPSLFEGGGMPIFEAFSSGVPVACSDATGLPRQAGGAALLFNPRDPKAIGEAMLRLWTDSGLRDRIVLLGRERVQRFSWERTARRYRALYRAIAGRGLTGEDESLLAEAPET